MTAQQLKNSILQMAVQGKLVPQDPNDEPASVLLERIRAEKEQLIKQKKIKREKNPSVIFKGADNTPYEKIGNGDPISLADEVPFDIPDTWEWARLGSISTYAETKQKVNAQHADPMIWGLDLEDIEKGGRLLVRKTVGDRKAVGDKTVFAKGDILYSKLRPYLLKILVAPDAGICTPEIVPFHLYGDILPEYVVCFLKSPYVDAVINSVTYGVKMPRVGTETMVNLLVPIPPIAEQIRIVEKICEVAPSVDAYALAYQQSELLNNTFPEALKKSILQQAVQGMLVPQDPTDEPAAILLERIRKEKEQLIKSGIIKRDKHESIIFRRDNSHYEKLDGIERCIDDEIPFEIPENWSWIRLSQLTTKIGAGSTPTGGRAVYLSEGVKFIRSQNVYNDGLRLNDIAYISDETNQKKSGSIVCPKDILLNITGGSIGRCAIVPDDFDIANVNQHVMIIRLIDPQLRMWIHTVLISEYVQNMIMDVQVGVSREGLSATKLKGFLLPIPPVAEQKRIIQRIRICTELL